jgi:hypothetical protein
MLVFMPKRPRKRLRHFFEWRGEADRDVIPTALEAQQPFGRRVTAILPDGRFTLPTTKQALEPKLQSLWWQAVLSCAD